jgi:hypothetical protein
MMLQSHKGFYVTNITDPSSGRVIFPNAVFSQEIRYRLVGFGGIPSVENTTFASVDGTDIFMGRMGECVYLRKEFFPHFTVRAKFATSVMKVTDGNNEYLIPEKRLDFGGNVDDVCTLSVTDCSVVLLTPYSNVVQSGFISS